MAWAPANRALCHVCGQQSLMQILVRALPPLWVFRCPECDAGHCPRCLRHLPVGDRYCTECGASVALKPT